MYIILVFKVFVPISLGRGPSRTVRKDHLHLRMIHCMGTKMCRSTRASTRRERLDFVHAGRAGHYLKALAKSWFHSPLKDRLDHLLTSFINTNIYSSLPTPLSESHLPSTKHSNSPTSPSSWPSLLNSRGRGACA
jgi:hypothetical protein